MDDKERSFLENWSKVLENFLFPLEISEKMEDFAEVHEQLFEETNRQKHYGIFKQSLLNSQSESIFGDFKNALKDCPDQKWLYDFMFEPESLASLAEYIHEVENIKAIKTVLHKLKPELHNIEGREFIEELRHLFSDIEWHEIDAILREKGNIYGLWKIFSILPHKEISWIKEMYNFVKKEGLRKTSGGLIAEALQEYFDVGFDREELEVIEEQQVLEVQGQIRQHVQSEKVEGGQNLFSDLHGENPENVPGCSQRMVKVDKKAEQVPEDCEEATSSCIHTSEPSTSANTCESLAEAEVTEENESTSEEQDFKLRGYQEYLVNEATNGGNCIICAPPGSGKTLIATHIILRVLEKHPGSRILFFAPSVALVNQHKQRLTTYLGEKYEIGCIHGRSENESDLRVVKLQIVCMTPQTFVNNLVKTAKLKDKSLRVLMTDFKCLIFDECHHCGNKRPYGNLMRQYMNTKDIGGSSDVPQIIGLTATLGVGRSIEMEKIKQNIKQLCATMDATGGIKTANNEHLVEMNKYIAHPEEVIIKLDERQTDEFTESLKRFMGYLVMKLEELKVFQNFEQETSGCLLRSFNVALKDSSGFRSKCDRLLALVEESQYHNKRDAIACLEYLKKCNRALEFHTHCQASDGLNILNLFLEETKAKSGEEANQTETEVFSKLTELTEQLETIILENDCSNKNLLKIKEKTLEAFESDPSSRVMVLVSERKFTEAIKEWMHTDDDLNSFNAEMFVGIVQSKKDGYRMDAEKQRQILDDFKRGHHKVLVCTVGAGGEGLDIVDCNLVITYKCIQNEISLVQTRGRVRKIGGKMVKMYDNQKSLLRDSLNSFKEVLMRKATAEVQDEISKDIETYLSMIKSLQHQNAAEFQLWCAKMAKDMENKNSDKEFHILCRVCSEYAFSSRDIRRATNGQVDTMTQVARATGQVININREFREKFTYRDHPRKKYMGPGWEKRHKIQCKKCGNDWGLEAQWRGLIDYPFPKMLGFVIVDPDHPNRLLRPSKWSDACFEPPLLDLESLAEALNQESQDKA